MGQVVWTAEAEHWLSEIHDHIAADNPAAAQRTVQGIYERGMSLADFPERGYRHTSRRPGRPLAAHAADPQLMLGIDTSCR